MLAKGTLCFAVTVVLAPTWAFVADPVFHDYRESGGLVIAAV